MAAGAEVEGDIVNCERTKEELAVQALTRGRNGEELDAAIAEHLGRCAECSAERQQLAEVAWVLSHVDPDKRKRLP
ncbi:hypothetical protein [Streptomyces sp. CO7]